MSIVEYEWEEYELRFLVTCGACVLSPVMSVVLQIFKSEESRCIQKVSLRN